MNNQFFKLMIKTLNMKFLAIPAIFLFAGCSVDEIDQDAAKFCACRTENVDAPSACNPLLQELSVKYQFDSEGAERLQVAIEECLPKD